MLGARRVDRCAEIAAEIDGTAVRLDVTDGESVEAFAAAVPDCRLLVNNAGGAKGLEPIAEADEDAWRWMFETNVMGTLRVTKALLPALLASGDGHIVTVTSIAATEIYDNGAGYTGREARAVGAAPDAARRAARAAGAAHRSPAGAGGDRLLAGPLRGRRGAGGAASTAGSPRSPPRTWPT